MTFTKGIAPTGPTSRPRIHATHTDGTTACGTTASPYPSGAAFDPTSPLACRTCKTSALTWVPVTWVPNMMTSPPPPFTEEMRQAAAEEMRQAAAAGEKRRGPRWPRMKRYWPLFVAERCAERCGKKQLAGRIYGYAVTRGSRHCG